MISNTFTFSREKVFWLFSFLLLATLSCGENKEEERKEDWISNEVNRQIEEFIIERKAECMEGILKTAEAEVDSIISQKDLFGNIMNKDIPEKPIKPEYIPLDSNALKNHKVEKVLD
ncbi:MAG: hypothetical protein P8M34_01920 [Saprospiraceae bacterium]|nr:hypothetical protein [Saprospiraceae bacterium]|tara:strand:- start:410 stop:760 length:351 start_codon:yes stop_codon:yes gene_type:complete